MTFFVTLSLGCYLITGGFLLITLHQLCNIIATVAGYLFGSERDARKYENAEYGYLDEEELWKLAHEEGGQRVTAKDGIIHYLNQNRWSIIGKCLLKNELNERFSLVLNEYLQL